jgi:hypothetical protein
MGLLDTSNIRTWSLGYVSGLMGTLFSAELAEMLLHLSNCWNLLNVLPCLGGGGRKDS